jgi:predicted RNA methylase
MNQLITRASIAEVARHRDAALSAFQRARVAEEEAKEQMAEAARILKVAAPFAAGLFSTHDVKDMTDRHYIDGRVWDSVIHSTELNHLMDKKAKDDLRQQLMTDAPEFTEENAYATLEHFMAEAGMIFRRGIAEMFSNLDRRFRSHSGWKIGSRVILNGMFGVDGWWNYYRDHRSTLQDIERTFLILDGRKPVADYAGIVGELDNARRIDGRGARQSEVESEFYTVRIFKNGNAHLWFKREDLVTKANRMIGEYYGEVIPEERKHAEDDGGLHEPKREMARNFGFFPTPDALAARTIDLASLYSRDGVLRVLEPSAGTGQLAKLAVKAGARVDCIEFQPHLANDLKASGIYSRVTCADFLSLKPETTGLYDRVIMNPPFDRERDIDHVMHALKFLNEGGLLVAIMSAHTEFAESKKATAFREHIARMNGCCSDNPSNSFSSVGTNVNTVTLKVWKNGRKVW